MAKIISNDCKFSALNHGFSCNKSDRSSPVMMKMVSSSNLKASMAVRSSAGGDFFGRPVDFGVPHTRVHTRAKMSLSIGKSLRWWEKGIQPNMKEITGAQDLVKSLLTAGDKLVVVDFFSPGCGGCKALHPKICQFAETNPDVQFLQVNYEDHKSMCYSLNVHVLPFFRFYRGAQGRVCSFSCTNATIKKFKDALAKHKPDRCSLGPPKGLEEKELMALAANRDLSFVYAPKPEEAAEVAAGVAALGSLSDPSPPLPCPMKSTPSEDKSFVSSGR